MKKRIENGIRLILDNIGEDWFIIIEEPETEKFVQFAYDEDSGLLFDLPFQALTTEEIALAEEVLKGFEIFAEKTTCLDAPDGQELGEFQSFSADVGRNVELAVNLVYAVFTKIYMFEEGIRFNISVDR